MKKCFKCKQYKKKSQFYKHIYSKDNLASWCKICDQLSQKIYRNLNKEQQKKYQKEYRKKNKKKAKLYRIKYYKENKINLLKDCKKYRENHKQERKEYLLKNKDKLNKQINSYHKKRKAKDINYKLTVRLRIRINNIIRNQQKTGSAIKDLGCSVNELRLYLESKFQKGMTWNNWAIKGWHIDHIIPLSSFNLSDRKEFIKACHYTNLQPLWWSDNLRKGNK